MPEIVVFDNEGGKESARLGEEKLAREEELSSIEQVAVIWNREGKFDTRKKNRTMDATFWKDYKRCTGDLTWRLAVPEDQAAIDRIIDASGRLLDEKQKRPNLFAAPVMLTLVAEDAEGTVVDAIYLEAQVEVVKVGCSSTSFIETAGIESDLYRWLRGLGLRTATVKTRQSLKEKMGYVLGFLGFHCEDDEFSRWTRDL